MVQVNLYDARTPLSRLVDRAAAGEEIVTAKGGRLLAGALPRHHADPFDHLLIAQARVENLTLVTAGTAFAASVRDWKNEMKPS